GRERRARRSGPVAGCVERGPGGGREVGVAGAPVLGRRLEDLVVADHPVEGRVAHVVLEDGVVPVEGGDRTVLRVVIGAGASLLGDQAVEARARSLGPAADALVEEPDRAGARVLAVDPVGAGGSGRACAGGENQRGECPDRVRFVWHGSPFGFDCFAGQEQPPCHGSGCGTVRDSDFRAAGAPSDPVAFRRRAGRVVAMPNSAEAGLTRLLIAIFADNVVTAEERQELIEYQADLDAATVQKVFAAFVEQKW